MSLVCGSLLTCLLLSTLKTLLNLITVTINLIYFEVAVITIVII